MATLNVRIPPALEAEIEAEARDRRVTKSDVIRERLHARSTSAAPAIADLIGSVDGLPADLSARRKHYLQITGYGEKRRR